MWARMRCMIISRATRLRPPSKTMMSANLRLGSTYCSCMGFTVVRYWVTTDWSVRPRSSPQSTAEDADVGIRLHKDLNVKHIPESGVLENQDARYDDNLGGEDFPGLLRAVVLHIRVDRAADGAALFQLLQMLDEQLCIKGGGVVIIYLGPFFQSLAVLTLIVIVMADDGDFRAEMLFQMPGEGGFAGAGTAGDTDQDGTHEEPPISYKVAGTWGAYW